MILLILTGSLLHSVKNSDLATPEGESFTTDILPDNPDQTRICSVPDDNRNLAYSITFQRDSNATKLETITNYPAQKLWRAYSHPEANLLVLPGLIGEKVEIAFIGLNGPPIPIKSLIKIDSKKESVQPPTDEEDERWAMFP